MGAKLAEQASEVARLMVSIESAGIGEQPDACGGNGVWLQTDYGIRAVESDAVGTQPNDGKEGWSKAKELAAESSGAAEKFVLGELIGGRGGTGSDVRDAKPEIEELAILGRSEKARCESGGVESWPESIAWPSEVMPGGGAVEAGIDPTEQDAKGGPDDIAKLAMNCVLELLRSGAEGMFHVEQRLSPGERGRRGAGTLGAPDSASRACS
jgi:hypothetical protein